MTLPRLSQDEMQTAFLPLEQAIFHHENWFEGVNWNLICGLAPDQRDATVDALRNCRFGRWLYGAGAGALSTYPGFTAIEVAYERMHQNVRQMMFASAAGQSAPIDDYERFVTSLKQMRLEVQTMKYELEDALCNLDPRTGAVSRVGMLTKLREQQEYVCRKVHFCCVAMMDLDLFKAVKDTYGHAVGDRVMVTLTRHLITHMRPYDMVFRYGGEEFLVCLPDADLKTGYDILDRLRQELSELPLEANGRPAFHVTGFVRRYPAGSGHPGRNIDRTGGQGALGCENHRPKTGGDLGTVDGVTQRLMR